MKLVAAILLTYVSVLVTAPALCAMEEIATKAGLSCTGNESDDCSKESDQSNEKSPCMPCCTVQSCQCYFITINEFNLNIQESVSISTIPYTNDKILSDYLSECWHPPELI